MNIQAKIEQVRSIYNTSRAPIPLILDLLRVKRSDYRAECDGLIFDLQAGCHEWYTIYENVIRADYFSQGITVQEGDTVIDIGANFGSFAIVAARKVGPTGKVIAFEPNPGVCQRLIRNVTINRLGNVEVRNEAVGGEDGEIVLLMQRRSSLTTTFTSIDQRVSEGSRPITVKASAIASVLGSVGGSVALLKIDCEGAEYEIFDGLDRESLAPVRQITMELHAVDGRSEREIVTKLENLGFAVRNTYPMLTAIRL